jgi:hypothetical protein
MTQEGFEPSILVWKVVRTIVLEAIVIEQVKLRERKVE